MGTVSNQLRGHLSPDMNIPLVFKELPWKQCLVGNKQEGLESSFLKL